MNIKHSRRSFLQTAGAAGVAAADEREQGVKVRIFVPEEEIPFGGHPTLGTAMVLRNLRMEKAKSRAGQTEDESSVALDLKVGKVPVDFREETSGNVFGEMHQVEPVFGTVHDRDMIAALLYLSPSDISSDAPIQSLSTGLFFIIVPIKNLSTLRRTVPLRPPPKTILNAWSSAG